MAEKPNTSSSVEYLKSLQNSLISYQSKLVEQFTALKQEFAGSQIIPDKIKEKAKDKIAENTTEWAINAVKTKIQNTIDSPIEEKTRLLDSGINTGQSYLEMLQIMLDTQDKNIFQRTFENSIHFISGQKDYVLAMYQQLIETGSTKSNFQQLSNNISETTSSVRQLYENPNEEKIDQTISSLFYSIESLKRYLNDKINETEAKVVKINETIVGSIQKKGGVSEYTFSLFNKASENITKNVTKAYSFFEGIKTTVDYFSAESSSNPQEEPKEENPNSLTKSI